MQELLFRNACLGDYNKIKTMWQRQGNVLGIPYKQEIINNIKKRTFFVIEFEGNIVCFAVLHYKKRKKRFYMEHIVVDETMRGKGIGTLMVLRLLRYTGNNDIYIECKEGAPNNMFYDKIGVCIGIKSCKTMNVRTYKIEKDKVIKQYKKER